MSIMYYTYNITTVCKNDKSSLPHLLISLYIDKVISRLILRHSKTVFRGLAL